MPKHPPMPKDRNQLAARIVAMTTGQPSPVLTPAKVKNPAAVALGRLGGLVGGKARAKALSAKQRSTIASEAATKKWKLYYDKNPKKG
jgi:hypothetical protein